MSRRLLSIICFVFLVFFTTSCATTQVIGVWVDEDFSGGAINNVFVLGVFKKPLVRNKLEDEFVKQLKQKNVTAEASFRSLPSDKLPDKDYLQAEVMKKGKDFVLITRLVDKKTEEYYEPGRSYVVPHSYYHTWDGYYHHTYRGVYTPGYYSGFGVYHEPGRKYEIDIYTVETNLYDVKTGKLVVSIMSDTTPTMPLDDVVTFFVKIVLSKLAENNLI